MWIRIWFFTYVDGQKNFAQSEPWNCESHLLLQIDRYTMYSHHTEMWIRIRFFTESDGQKNLWKRILRWHMLHHRIRWSIIWYNLCIHDMEMWIRIWFYTESDGQKNLTQSVHMRIPISKSYQAISPLDATFQCSLNQMVKITWHSGINHLIQWRIICGFIFPYHEYNDCCIKAIWPPDSGKKLHKYRLWQVLLSVWFSEESYADSHFLIMNTQIVSSLF
jgi:hypothetical protein